MAKTKATPTDNLLVKRPDIAKWYSQQNEKLVTEVLPTESSQYLFECSNPKCGKIFLSSPSKMKGVHQVVYCDSEPCQKRCKEHIDFLKLQGRIRKNGSLATLEPEIAKTWVKTVDEYEFPYSPDTVSRRSDILVQWQCGDVDYHVWEQTVDGRVTHPNCPCCTGQRVHIKDSYYTKLEKQGLLEYLDESEHEKAKEIILGHKKLKLLHKCRSCGKLDMRYPRVFLYMVTGCSHCQNEKSTKTRRVNSAVINGSVADNPSLLDQYCYAQVDVPDNKKNPHPPEDIPLNYTTSVHWRCEKGHFSKSPVHLRNKGVICSRCSSQSSFIEVLLYKELEAILGSEIVEFRGKILDKESDIILNLDSPIALEVDGYHYHKGEDKAKRDTEKGAVFKSEGYRVIRVREEGLEEIPNMDLCIPFAKKGTSQKDVLNGKHKVVLQVINSVLSYLGRDKIEELSCLDATNKFYVETRKVSFSESVAATHPKLLQEVDVSKCSLDLSKLSAGSNAIINWKCSVCDHRWAISVARRAGKKPTGCPACAGQVVTEKNSLAALAPGVVEALCNPQDAHEVVVGSGKILQFKCTFEGCTAEPAPRIVREAVKQFNKHGHNYFHECNH
ncbi:TPA: zinc-ribbon domain-containing protein [Photobacterium damselae]